MCGGRRQFLPLVWQFCYPLSFSPLNLLTARSAGAESIEWRDSVLECGGEMPEGIADTAFAGAGEWRKCMDGVAEMGVGFADVLWCGVSLLA